MAPLPFQRGVDDSTFAFLAGLRRKKSTFAVPAGEEARETLKDIPGAKTQWISKVNHNSLGGWQPQLEQQQQQ